MTMALNQFLIASAIIADQPGAVERSIQNIKHYGSEATGFLGHMIADHPNEFITAISTIVIAGFTALLAIKTSGLFRETAALREVADKQRADMLKSIQAGEDAAKAAKRSADVAERTMVLTDRPWIELDLEIAGPLKIGTDTVEIPIKGSFKNIGKSPAISVHFDFELASDIVEAVSKAADAAARVRGTPVAFWMTGQVVFPGKGGSSQRVVSFPRARLLERIEEVNKDAESNPPSIKGLNPALYAFAYYGLPSGGRMGHFRYTTLLLEIYSALVPDGFDGSKMIVVQDNMELVATIFSGETT